MKFLPTKIYIVKEPQRYNPFDLFSILFTMRKLRKLRKIAKVEKIAKIEKNSLMSGAFIDFDRKVYIVVQQCSNRMTYTYSE